MTHRPPTFRALDQGWTLSAVHLPEAAPNEVATALTEGISAAVPGEAHLDLRRAGLIADPFDGDNEAAQQWIGDTGTITLRAGRRARIRITSPAGADPESFAATLRCVNDLL
jgi:hypothetical protein